MSVTLEQRIRGSFFGGALGDALGAPIEGKRSLDKIRVQYGPNGIQEFDHYINHWAPEEPPFGVGALTDDTTMSMGTAWGIIETARNSKTTGPDFIHRATYYTWQNYLNWGSKQKHANDLRLAINPNIAWSDEAKEFWFTCGAGKGTIEALNTMCMGTPNDPLTFIVPGRTEKPEANGGSGGMMRCASLGFLSGFRNVNVTDITNRNVALTHGGEDVLKTAAFVTNMIAHSTQDMPLRDALTHQAVYFFNGNQTSDQAFHHAREKAQSDASADAINAIPDELGYGNQFLNNPIFAQVVYVAYEFAKNPAPTVEDFKNSLRLAVNHSGDTDTVGAIAGNIIGAFHPEALPEDWINQLQHREAVGNTAKTFANQLRL